MKNMSKILPFLESGDLWALAQEILNGNVKMNIVQLLPFMDEEDVDKICADLAAHPEHCNGISLISVYPFASEKYVDELFLSQAKSGKVDESALPFVSEECLHKLIEEYAENPDIDLNVDALYPFLQSEDISLLFKTYLKRAKNA